jgi:hypothetical protein
MPVAMTFNSLQNDIRAYIERGSAPDVTVFAQIPTLINDAEREIARKLKIQGFIANVTTAFAAGSSVYPKPDRWRETISMEFGTGLTQQLRKIIYPRVYEYLRVYWPDPTQTAPPEFYADYDYLHWLIAPTPDLIYPWQINYYELPPLLDNTNQTNWLTNYAPTTLRFCTLLQTAPFLKNDERVPVWQQLYQESLQSLGGEDLQKIVDRTSTRQGA